MAEITQVAVVGGGYMGGGIAQVLALDGATVQLADSSAELARSSRERLLSEAAGYERTGLFAAGSAEIFAQRLVAAESIEAAVEHAEFVEEVVPEVPEIKLEVLARVSAAMPATAIVGTNTSSIAIHDLAAAFADPSRFLGVHFMNPAPFVPGVEVVVGERTDPGIVPPVETMLRSAGKRPARVADVEGFVCNRLQYALLKEAIAVVAEGQATAADVDTVVSNSFGFRLAVFGPFAIADMAGLDVYADAFRVLESRFGERLAAPELLTELVEQGRHGTKTGGGFLDIGADRVAALTAYRNTAYQRLSALLAELGPPPLDGSAS